MTPPVLFLPDSGDRIGGGHVMRCLTLANRLAEAGCAARFLAGPAGLDLLEAFGWTGERAQIGETATAAELVAAASGARVAVLDSYRLDARHEAALAEAGLAVAVIDDLADRPHHCTLLVDPGFGRTPEDYAGLVPAGARVLAGTAYAALRPGFAATRPQALARRDGRPVGRVLVSLGLTDVGGITARVVETLWPVLAGLEVDVLVGKGAASLAQLYDRARRHPGLRIHVNATDVEALMSAADAAIGAGGSSTWERACLGLPSLSLILADNQRPMAGALDRAGAVLAVHVGAERFAHDLAAAWARLSGDAGLRTAMSRLSAGLCDGQGAGRIAQALQALIH